MSAASKPATAAFALVTGASRGIGRSSALALAKAGAQVLVHYNGGEKDATAVVAEIRKADGKAEKVTADLRASDGPHALAERVRAIVGGRLDILVRPTLRIRNAREDHVRDRLRRLQRSVFRGCRIVSVDGGKTAG